MNKIFKLEVFDKGINDYFPAAHVVNINGSGLLDKIYHTEHEAEMAIFNEWRFVQNYFEYSDHILDNVDLRVRQVTENEIQKYYVLPDDFNF